MINWNNAREAEQAFEAGHVPPGCIFRLGGLLVVEEPASHAVRGASVVYALAHTIVTTKGRVLKSRDLAVRP